MSLTAKTDQIGRMPRLIRVVTGRRDHFVGFVVRRLNLIHLCGLFYPCKLEEPICASSRENLSSGFSTRSDSNQPAQLEKPARTMKLQILKLEMLYHLGSEQQRCWSDCAGWSAPLLFAYGVNRFSHGVAHLLCKRFTEVLAFSANSVDPIIHCVLQHLIWVCTVV